MARAESKATAIWSGNLTEGSGKVSASSGAFRDQAVSWSARTNRNGAMSGVTSPEELLAAALASCFAMAFSNGLNKNDTPPEQLNITATGAFEQVDGGWKISTIHLDITGQVSGIDQSNFARLAQEAAQGCPVSTALRGNVDVSVDAKLQQ